MTLEVQFKIKNTPFLRQYIRENSYWYKILNRDPGKIRELEEEAKAAYKLRPTDRIQKLLETVDMVQTLMASLK